MARVESRIDLPPISSKGRLVPFLTFPRAPILVVPIARFDKLEAVQTDENPKAAFVEPNAVERIVHFGAALAGFGADTFDNQVNSPVDRGSGSARTRTPAWQHALLPDQPFFHATYGRKRVLIRTASNE